MESEDTDDISEILAALLEQVWQINRLVSSRAPHALSPSHYRTLGLLIDSGPLRVGDLADQVHVSQPGMTKILHALGEAGAIDRERDPDDSRATLVTITDTGRAMLPQHAAEYVAFLQPTFAALGADDRRKLQNAVEILSTLTAGARTAPGKETR